MGNDHGRAQALTVMSPLRTGWALWLRLHWPFAKRIPLVIAPLKQLRFIHFAHWSLVDRLPVDRSLPAERLHQRYLLFQSNFNRDWAQYIDSFSFVVPGRMRGVWLGAWGFPGPRPVSEFKPYIRRNEFEAGHYYSAYPDASTSMILSALELRERYEVFAAESAGLELEAFQAACRRFVDEVQEHLWAT